MNLHRAAALIVFVAAVAACVNPALLRFPWTDLALQHRMWTLVPEAEWRPDYAQFLEDVRARTRPGDSILIVLSHGYSFGYYRASYSLAGRDVLPAFSAEGAPLPGNAARARYVAAWSVPRFSAGGRVVFAGHHGVLLER